MKKPRFIVGLLVFLNLQTIGQAMTPKKAIQNFKATNVVTLEGMNIYVGNTLKISIPKESGKIIKEVSHYSLNESVATVTKGVVMGKKEGETTIISQVTYQNANNSYEYVEFITPVKILVGNLKLKTYYSTKFNMNGAQILKERESTYVSVGKTAKIVPALSYGVFTGIRYESSNPEIATVKRDGLNAMVTGVAPGKATIIAYANIAGKELEQKIVVDVRDATIPVSNPQDASDYTEESEWVGDRVYFGRYEQDNNFANGSEPILWRVLEVTDESVLLLSEYGLESKNINDSFTKVTWATSTMRQWLNETFINKAFTNYELSVIMDNKIHTPANTEWGTSGGKDTIDKAFLLSVEEATNPAYGFYSDFSKASASRIVRNTKYATVNDGYTNKTNGNTCWWLRSTGMEQQFAYFFTNGSGTYSYFVGRRNDAVRPAIRVKLSDISFAVNEKKGGYPYIIVN